MSLATWVKTDARSSLRIGAVEVGKVAIGPRFKSSNRIVSCRRRALQPRARHHPRDNLGGAGRFSVGDAGGDAVNLG